MEARAIQRHVRQSARKMRLVVDLIRGRSVPEAYAILRFSKKRAARQIRKVLTSAVANAKQAADRQNERLDEDQLRVKLAVVNEGPTLKRFAMAAMGRATPIKKRTSHVEIQVISAPAPAAKPAAPAPTAKADGEKAGGAPTPRGRGKGSKAKAKAAAGGAKRRTTRKKSEDK
jgi:large subunit ribosomal protein L22